jgi:HK97 gp10 family phage protein
MEIKLDLKLNKQADRAINDSLTRGLRIIAIELENAAKDLCPANTGNLRNSISHFSDDESATVATNVEYGIYQEYGTKKMSAQPFMRPALYNNKDKIVQILRGVLNDRL